MALRRGSQDAQRIYWGRWSDSEKAMLFCPIVGQVDAAGQVPDREVSRLPASQYQIDDGWREERQPQQPADVFRMHAVSCGNCRAGLTICKGSQIDIGAGDRIDQRLIDV